ncbi:MAG: DUF1045 domain-containing protein, partial [Deltaproteobacteria bacterium]|nr:DUF1045 domain-containing protein [Deltaproteobacteria bacterium]
MTERFSVYHVPNPTAKLYGIGSAILGRCVYTGNTLAPPWPKYFSPSVPPHPARASVYGFHATLVAPFRTLVPVQTLAETLENLCQTIDSFEVGPLELSLLEPGFPALIPKEAPPALSALEERLVKTFAAYALPIEPEDLARREPLTARQRALAKKWGYPYVLDQFRYHLTLGDPLNETADDLSRDKLNYLDLLHSLLSDEIVASHHLDSLCLCRQASKGGPFKVITVSNFRTDPTRSEPTGADPTGSDLMCPDP